MDANGMTFFSMGKSNEFWEITRISPGNNAKLGGSFAEIRNVCIFLHVFNFLIDNQLITLKATY